VVFRLKDARFLGHISERSISVVVIQHVLAVVGYEQVQEAVVVVVSYTDALAPTRVE